jgi:hypothetical protein
MFAPGTAQRMKDALPKARIIAVLRDPAVKLRNTNLKKPTLSPSLRDELADLYRDDVNALQSISGRDLVHWSSGTGA